MALCVVQGSSPAGSPTSHRSAASGPGADHVAWAEGEGSADIERIFAGSAKMDGESVVVFFRAMCAVSQEELEDGGRVYMLQKLVECAHHNLGRIRLVWARLWAALTPHIINATCHSDLKVRSPRAFRSRFGEVRGSKCVCVCSLVGAWWLLW